MLVLRIYVLDIIIYQMINALHQTLFSVNKLSYQLIVRKNDKENISRIGFVETMDDIETGLPNYQENGNIAFDGAK